MSASRQIREQCARGQRPLWIVFNEEAFLESRMKMMLTGEESCCPARVHVVRSPCDSLVAQVVRCLEWLGGRAADMERQRAHLMSVPELSYYRLKGWPV